MYKTLIAIGTWVLNLMGERVAKEVILSFLSALAKRTDNTLDDRLLRVLRTALENQKDTNDLSLLLSEWTKDKDGSEGGS